MNSKISPNKETDKELMRVRDLITPSPELRAKYIWNKIQGDALRPWDIICFCCEAFALFASEYEFLKPAASYIVSIVYTAHYHTPQVYPSSCPLPSPQSALSEQDTKGPSLIVEKSGQQS